MLKLKYAVLAILSLTIVCFTGTINPSVISTSQVSRSLWENIVAPVAAHNSPSISAQIPSRPRTPTVSVRYKYYPIRGRTDTELRSQMSQKGPLDALEGRRYDAYTAWTVNWSYRYKSVGKQCTIASVQTKVGITFTLPKWQPASGTPRSLKAEWKQYLAALQTHEDGHKYHGIAAGQDVIRTLSRFPSAASCSTLGTTANQAAQQIIQRYNQKDIEYDRLTQHGFTQGAVFPTMSTGSRQ